MSKTLILVQGKADYIPINTLAWRGYDVLFSTWDGEQSKFTGHESVIYNTQSSVAGPANLNYQQVSTYNGLLYALDNGYTHVLKIRSDVYPTNANSFMNTLDYSTLNFLCWHEHEVYPSCPGYLVDYLMFGETNEMLKLWDIKDNFCNVPEVILTWNYITNCTTNVSYFLDSLSVDNDLIWIKNNLRLSSYQKSDRYDKYKKYDFSNSKDFLTTNYLNFLKKQ